LFLQHIDITGFETKEICLRKRGIEKRLRTTDIESATSQQL